MKPSIALKKPYTRTAGALYLLIAVFGAFSIGYVPSIIADSDGTILQNLLENIGLYKLGIVADTVVILVEVILTAMLYQMFIAHYPTVSILAAFARMAMVTIMAVNLLISVTPLFLLDSGAPLEELSTTISTLFTLHQNGINTWQIFFGLHLLALGGMVIKSGFFPRVLGWMMAVGAAGYTGQGVANIVMLENTFLTYLIIGLLTLATLGELAFAVWLVVKGAVQ